MLLPVLLAAALRTAGTGSIGRPREVAAKVTPVKVIIAQAPTMVWVPAANGTSPGRLLAFTSCEDYSVCMSTSTDLGASWDTGNVTAALSAGGGGWGAKAPLHMAGLPFAPNFTKNVPGFWGLGAALHVPGTQRVILEFGNLTTEKG